MVTVGRLCVGVLQRAQYQDKLARQRYDDQLRQQVSLSLTCQMS